MKKIIFLLLCGVIPFLLSSCSNDDDNGGTGTETVKQITKLDLTSTDNVILTFDYDSQNRLSSCVTKESNSTSTEVYEYNNDGKLIKQIYSVSSASDEEDYVEFSYSGNTVTATEHYRYSDDEQEGTYTETYTLNEKGLITKKISEDGDYHQYTYDSNNNLTKAEFYGSEEGLMETETWEYDSKNSFLSNMGLPAWYSVAYNDDFAGYAGKNNFVKYNYKEIDEPEKLKVRSYTYDADGYPTSLVLEGKTVYITYRTINK